MEFLVDEVEEVIDKFLSVDIDEGICEFEKLDDIDENELFVVVFIDDDFFVYGRDVDGDILFYFVIIFGYVMFVKVFVEVVLWM